MKNFILITIMILINHCGFTQSKSVNGLDKYLEIAGKNNPAIQASYNQYLAALQKVPQVGALPDPQGALGFFLKPMALVEGNQIGNISVMQMFPWFGTLKYAKDEASLMAKARFKQFQEDKAELFYNVSAAWYQIGKINHEIILVNENIQFLESLEKLALVKFKSPSGGSSVKSFSGGSVQMESQANNGKTGGNDGMNSQTVSAAKPATNSPMPSPSGGEMGSKQTGLADVLSVRMEILDQQNQLALLKDRKKSQVAYFNSLLNQDQSKAVEIPDTMKMESLSVPLLAIADSIVAKNPMLAMLDAEGESYSAMREKSRKMGFPMVGLGVNYMVIQKQSGNPSMMNGKDMVMPMVNFSIPIYRKKYNAMQKEAKLLQESTVQKSADLKNNLLVQYHQLVQDLNDALRRVDLYREQADLAKRSSGLLLAGFTSGDTDYREVLRMQYKVLDYGFKFFEAVADYNTSVAQVDKLMNAVTY